MESVMNDKILLTVVFGVMSNNIIILIHQDTPAKTIKNGHTYYIQFVIWSKYHCNKFQV